MTDENQMGEPEVAAVKDVPQTNLQHLSTHLVKDSLARKLVAAREVSSDSDEPLREIIRERLKELREAYDDPVIDQED